MDVGSKCVLVQAWLVVDYGVRGPLSWAALPAPEESLEWTWGCEMHPRTHDAVFVPSRWGLWGLADWAARASSRRR